MKKLLITAMLFTIITMAACAGNNNTPEPPIALEESNTAEENTALIEIEAEHTVSSENNGLVWLVEPTLDYDFIYHCCFFSTANHGGEFIDSTTGLITEWPQDLAFGHGPIQGWVYDPSVSLFGLGGVGDYSGIMMLSIEEWTAIFAPFNEQHGLMPVQLVDSSMRNITELGSEYLSDDAYSGRYAVMLNGTFLTDFIFDGGSMPGLGNEILHNTIPMHIGNTWGFVDNYGNIVIPLLFEHIVRIDDDSAFARYNGRYGIISIPQTISNFYPEPTAPMQTQVHPQPENPTIEPPSEQPTTVTIGGLEFDTSSTHLILNDMHLTEEDLAPLRYFSHLIYLNLSGNSILDLSQTYIPKMTNLINLDISGNATRDEWYRGIEWLSDISQLRGLTNLTWLSVANNSIEDISVLAGLTELSYLHIGGNIISDITPLQGLTNLTKLRIGLNRVQDLSPIRHLENNLLALCLNWARLTDISDVAHLTRLIWLDLADNQQLSDITPISNLTELQSLNMSSIMVYDLTPLANLTSLEWLNISGNTGQFRITDLSPLQNLHNLNTLVFFGHGFYVTDWSPVSHVENILPPLS